ncbi:hypothetical protein V7419_27445 [Bacillus sp. JJ689]|uniref:hypothetical protein n=1 Tax=Bacillus sp. JJ689 TaxID=3122949 RepID=UPI002FFDBA01
MNNLDNQYPNNPLPSSKDNQYPNNPFPFQIDNQYPNNPFPFQMDNQYPNNPFPFQMDNQYPPISKNDCYKPDICQLKPGYYKWIPPHWECCDCYLDKKIKY